VGAELGEFDDLVRRYRRELHVYCYRMLGSFDEAEDHVQEVLSAQSSAPSSPQSSAPAAAEPSIVAMPWVQPYPDTLLDEVAAGQPGPEAVAVSRETISLAFLAAIQLLPPRQRAVLILRDVVSLPAAEVAEVLDTSVPAVTSALQRARARPGTSAVPARPRSPRSYSSCCGSNTAGWPRWPPSSSHRCSPRSASRTP
jgi:RNA polymerase sigma-70 factor, ECF subfamily